MRYARVHLFLSYVLLGAACTRADTHWLEQFGTPRRDSGEAVYADRLGNVYVAGETLGSLGGPDSGDLFLAKFNADGDPHWIRQFGAPSWDSIGGVSADESGNVYVCGTTHGQFSDPNDSPNAFLRKYDPEGNALWTRHEYGFHTRSGAGVSADAMGNVYLAGSTPNPLPFGDGNDDAYLYKYDSDGTRLWTRSFGAPELFAEGASGVSADAMEGVYLGGTRVYTRTGEANGFLARYDASGNRSWYGYLDLGRYDILRSVSADGLGNVYVCGDSFGDLSHLGFVAKYDSLGNRQWVYEETTAVMYNVSADALGGVYVGGRTWDASGGTGESVDEDAFIRKLDSEGNPLWLRRLASPEDDGAYGVSADGLGNVYFVGETRGSLAGPNAGGDDVFVGKIPEPSTIAMLCAAAVTAALAVRCRRRAGG